MLIDNIFIHEPGRRKCYSFVLTDSMSDHYPCLLSMVLSSGVCDSPQIMMEKRKLTDESILKIQQELLFHDWSRLNNPDMKVNGLAIEYSGYVEVNLQLLNRIQSRYFDSSCSTH